MIRFVAIVVLIPFVFVTSSSCRADVFNIDFEASNGTPSSNFGGVDGDSGTWNAIGFSEARNTDVPLVTNSGSSSNVLLNLLSQAGGTARMTNPGYSGDAAQLLTDGWVTPDIPNLVTIKNLGEGDFRVIVYGLVGNGAGSGIRAGVNVNGQAFDVGGYQWNDGFVEGETHQDILVSLTANENLRIRWTAASFGGNGAVSGIQIRKIDAVPEPGSMVFVSLLGLIGLRHRRRSSN